MPIPETTDAFIHGVLLGLTPGIIYVTYVLIKSWQNLPRKRNQWTNCP